MLIAIAIIVPPQSKLSKEELDDSNGKPRQLKKGRIKEEASKGKAKDR